MNLKSEKGLRNNRTPRAAVVCVPDSTVKIRGLAGLGKKSASAATAAAAASNNSDGLTLGKATQTRPSISKHGLRRSLEDRVTMGLHPPAHTTAAEEKEGEIYVVPEEVAEDFSGGENEDTTMTTVAVPVYESTRSLQTAQPMERESIHGKESWKKRYLYLGIAALFVLLLVGIIIVVALKASQKEETKDRAPKNDVTEPPTDLESPWPPKERLFEMPDYTEIALLDPNSPQSKAYRWVLADPYLANYTRNENPWRQKQRFALATLYYATNGDNWTRSAGWMSYEIDECLWYWVPAPVRKTPCMINGTKNLPYEALWLRNNILSGTIPPELYLLDQLQDLQLDDNPLIGTIPPQLYQHTKLHTVMVHRTDIQGTVPTEIGRMQQLRAFAFGKTKIQGTLPTELGRLQNLELFLTGANPLAGTIPSELGLCSILRMLTLDDTILSGSLPYEVAQITTITILDVENTNLTGEIPAPLWENSNLERLKLGGNGFEGTLPSIVGKLSQLRWLSLPRNRFSGTLPTELGLLRKLTKLLLTSNEFTGWLPSELANLPSLTRMSDFDVSQNLFTGEVPDGLCSTVFSFDCSTTLCGCDCPCNNHT